MKTIPALALLALLAACGPSEPAAKAPAPSAAQAAKPAPLPPPAPAGARTIIESSSDLGEFQFTSAAVTLPMKKSAMNAPALESAKQLAAAGWLRFNGDELELADKAKDDSRFLVRGNGFIDVVPIAKKEMGDVTSVRPSKEGVDADFTWKWVPTEVGKSFRKGAVHEMFGKPHNATATLMSDGSNWTVLRIVERQ